MIAALFVEKDGCYFNLPGIDPWDESRDARLYPGPHKVIAHPPCQRWGKFWAGQPLHIKLTGERQIKGNDGGCFALALLAVRTYGGIIEHPEGSHAWAHFGISKPPRAGGWIAADAYGKTCCVEQGQYGHYARKPTWLYAVNIPTPELRWANTKWEPTTEMVERYGIKRAKRLGELGTKGGGRDSSVRIATPPEFRDLLIAMVSGSL